MRINAQPRRKEKQPAPARKPSRPAAPVVPDGAQLRCGPPMRPRPRAGAHGRRACIQSAGGRGDGCGFRRSCAATDGAGKAPRDIPADVRSMRPDGRDARAGGVACDGVGAAHANAREMVAELAASGAVHGVSFLVRAVAGGCDYSTKSLKVRQCHERNRALHPWNGSGVPASPGAGFPWCRLPLVLGVTLSHVQA